MFLFPEPALLGALALASLVMQVLHVLGHVFVERMGRGPFHHRSSYEKRADAASRFKGIIAVYGSLLCSDGQPKSLGQKGHMIKFLLNND